MLELRERFSRLQLVEVVDDQHQRFDWVGDLGKDRVDGWSPSSAAVAGLRIDEASGGAR